MRVRYTIKAKIHSHNGAIMKYKQHLIVHEPPVAFEQGRFTDVTTEISECFGAKGTCKLYVRFSKNVFYSNEIAYAEVTVDNSQCDLAVEEVEFQVV